MAQQALDEADDNPGSDAEASDDDDNEVLDSDDDEEDRGFLSSRRGVFRNRNNNTFLEFSQETMSKAQVFKRLILCSLMLNVTFVTWGALQV